MTRLCSLQPNILTVQPSCASSTSRDAASFTPCLTFFTGRCYHPELLDSSPLHACASLGMAPTSQTFGRLLRENAGREHRDEASQAKQPWHWQSERAAIVQRNTPPLMKTPAPHCQQLNLPPPKSPGGGITREWCTTGGSHGGRRRWQEWLRESEWGFFLLLFQGWKQEEWRGRGTWKRRGSCFDKQAQNFRSESRISIAKSAEKAPYNLSQSLYSGIKWLLWGFLTKGGSCKLLLKVEEKGRRPEWGLATAGGDPVGYLLPLMDVIFTTKEQKSQSAVFLVTWLLSFWMGHTFQKFSTGTDWQANTWNLKEKNLKTDEGNFHLFLPASPVFITFNCRHCYYICLSHSNFNHGQDSYH